MGYTRLAFKDLAICFQVVVFFGAVLLTGRKEMFSS